MAEPTEQQFGHYRLINLLGSGPYTSVYLGEHIRLKTQVAVKKVDVLMSPNWLDKFSLRAGAIAGLRHPNIARVLDFGVEDSAPFLVMQYASNGTLRQHHPKGSRLPLASILPYVEQVAAALQYAHDQRVLHCDVKPENMLLSANNQVLLSDFDLGIIDETLDATLNNQTRLDAEAATYMAPEVFQGKAQPASDQYALGIVVYEWLCGTRPFTGTFGGIVAQHIQAYPLPLSRHAPDISPPVEQVVLKALAKNPGQRFESIQAFASALEGAEKPVPAVQVSTREPTIAVSQPEQTLVSALARTPSPRSKRTDLVGRQFGNYRLVHSLGYGGFSDVYLGEHIYLQTQAAIKILQMQLTTDDLENFLSEARIVARLSHPNIVRVLEFGVEDNTPFLVMEYAPNGNLRQRHPRGTTLPLATIAGYVKQIAAALQYAHDHRVIHRDIKPENMLLGRNNEVLLSDFGIAVAAASTNTGDPSQSVIGTVVYMAPEHLQGKARAASDQYALAVVVYEWLCGARPFDGSFTSIAFQHMLVPPPLLSQKVPLIPPTVERVVMTALSKDPSKRFKTMLAFADALEQACQLSQAGEGSFLVSRTLGSIYPTSPQDEPTYVPPAASPSVSLLPVDLLRTEKLAPPRVLPPTLGNPLVTYRGHNDWVRAVAWAPDSRRIASASNDKTVHVWNAATGRKLSTCRGRSDAVYTVAWAPPDGKCIAFASADKTIRVWEAATGRKVSACRGHTAEVYAVSWSPDGALIASASADRTIQIWDAVTQGKVASYTGHNDWVRAVAWSPDGKYIASASNDKTVQVWDATTRQNISTYTGHSDWVRAVAWSPDSKYIASASNDKTVQVWNAMTGIPRFTYEGHTGWWLGGVLSVAWSPDGTLIASAGEDQTIRVWDAVTSDNVFIYRGHSAPVSAIAWSPDGKYIASAGHDRLVRVWQAP